MSVVLDFVNVSKTYGSPWRRVRTDALQDLTFSVESGEIFGFLGPNGAGKTTAIHLAMGFLRASSGSGYMLGHPFGHAATRARVGFLPESVPLYPRPAAKLLRFYGALNGLRDPLLRERCRDVLQTVDLAPQAHRNVGGFSHGMQQRVGLAQALLNDPELLILDEPTSALDPLGRIAVRELLLAANRRGKTVFLSSHLLAEAEAVCHRVGILHRGKLLKLLRISDLQLAGSEFEIIARGVPSAAIPGSRIDRDNTLVLQVKAPEQRNAIRGIWELGGEVLRVNPVHRSLEEIFAGIVQAEGQQSEPGDAQ